MQIGSFGYFLLIMLIIVVGFGFLVSEYLDLRVDNQELVMQVAALQTERQQLISANTSMTNQLRQAEANIVRLQQEKELQRSEFERLLEQRAVVCQSTATGGQGIQIGGSHAVFTSQTGVKAGLSRWFGQHTNQRWLIGLFLASLLLIGIVFLSTYPTGQQRPTKRTVHSPQQRQQVQRFNQTR